MLKDTLEIFLTSLKEKYILFGPTVKEGDLVIDKIVDIKKLEWSSGIPTHPPKTFFVPQCEVLFNYIDNQLTKEVTIKDKKALIVSLIDLKALPLYDKVFANDIYYKERRENIIVIGHGRNPNPIYLKNVPFDIFIGRLENDQFKLFIGSQNGKRLTKDLHEKSEFIEYTGPEKETERFQKMREMMRDKYNQVVWDELGKKCIECGKCTIVCPICFCFKIEDQATLKNRVGKRMRSLDSCFYNDFSLMAGGVKSLKNTAQKIHFWYTHKFVRIPKQYKAPIGCIECLRCFKVCPANINIEETIDSIINK